jgi:hypothetical protein
VASGEWREGTEKQILRSAQDDNDWNGTNGEAASDSSARRLARRTDKTGDRSVPYSLILETDNAYTVISQGSNEQAMQFNREAVEGYIVLKQN